MHRDNLTFFYCWNAQILGAWSSRWLNVVPWHQIFSAKLVQVSSSFSPLPYTKTCHQFTICTKHKVPEAQITGVHRSLQNCGSSVWDLLYVILLAHRIWRWLLDFLEICESLNYSLHTNFSWHHTVIKVEHDIQNSSPVLVSVSVTIWLVIEE
jgi:hypothetical protein